MLLTGLTVVCKKMSVHVPLMTGYFNRHSLKLLAKYCQSKKRF